MIDDRVVRAVFIHLYPTPVAKEVRKEIYAIL